MSCSKCEKFPCPTANFAEIGISTERHGTLYQCKVCHAYYEIIECDRNTYELEKESAEKLYKIV
jgi:hypothetical protein